MRLTSAIRQCCLILGFASILGTLACDGGSPTGSVDGEHNTTPGTLVIPPEGGVFALNGERVELEVPAGVFAAETTISIEMSDEGLAHPGYFDGSDVDFGSSLLDLPAPVTLRYRIRAEDIPAGAAGTGTDICRAVDGVWIAQGAVGYSEGEVAVREITRRSLSRHALIAPYGEDEVCEGEHLQLVTTMAELEAYRGCRAIGGDLRIEGQEITSLEALSSLESLQSLLLTSLNLTDLTGLENLRRVNTLRLSSVHADIDMHVLDNLESCMALEFQSCPDLVEIDWAPRAEVLNAFSVSACANLETVRIANLQSLGALRLETNSMLTEVEFTGSVRLTGSFNAGFDSELVAIRGLEFASDFAGEFRIDRCELLEVLPGGGRLRSMGGFIDIERAQGLVDLDFFAGLESVGGNVSITTCDNLESLSGLESLNDVGGDFSLGFSPALTTLGNLHALSTMQNLNIQQCNALSDLAGLGGLTVAEDILIETNGSLVSIAGLGGTAGGSLEVSHNPVLADFSGLSLSHVGSACFIFDNDGLTSLTGLSVLSGYTTLLVRANPVLSDLNGLHDLIGLTSIEISHNGSLVNMSGLESLTEVGSLEISNNANIANLGGLDNLTTVTNTLRIHSNNIMWFLRGLESLFSVGDLLIQANPVLQDLEALDDLARVGWTGPVQNGSLRIIGNAMVESLEPLYGLHTDPASGDVIPGDCIITGNWAMDGDNEGWEFIDAIGGASMVGGDIIIDN